MVNNRLPISSDLLKVLKEKLFMLEISVTRMDTIISDAKSTVLGIEEDLQDFPQYDGTDES